MVRGVRWIMISEYCYHDTSSLTIITPDVSGHFFKEAIKMYS